MYAVGQLFEEGKTSYQEGARFDLREEGAFLFFYYKAPTYIEIEDITGGKIELGLYIKEEMIFALFKFGGQNWFDAPYTVHLSPKYEFKKLEDHLGVPMHVFVIDANTGIIKGMRLIALPNKFTGYLYSAVVNQKTLPFDKEKYFQKINQIYGNYSTEDILERAEFRLKFKSMKD